MKATLVERILEGSISVTEAARSVKKSRCAIYDWMTKFRAGGINGLLPKKTGPKGGRAWNRTAENREQEALALIEEHPTENIYDIADRLEHALHPSTIWRIWKRHHPDAATKRLPRPAPVRYVKETVGEEIQMDTSFPWGRMSQRVCFDCLDDHSRFAFAKLFMHCDQDSAIAFLHYVIARAPFTMRAIRTDCGREWSTWFSIACAFAGITHVRNEPYHPEHNGKISRSSTTVSSTAASTSTSTPPIASSGRTATSGSGSSGTTTTSGIPASV